MRKFNNLDGVHRGKITLVFYGYLFITISILAGVMILTAYYKHQYGNYDAL
jgi:hypothetical protein